MASNIPFCYFVFATEEMTLLHGPTICRQHRNEPGNRQEEGRFEETLSPGCRRAQKERKKSDCSHTEEGQAGGKQADCTPRLRSKGEGAVLKRPAGSDDPGRPRCTPARAGEAISRELGSEAPGAGRGVPEVGAVGSREREQQGPGNGSNGSRERGQRVPGTGATATHGAVHGHFLPCTGMYRDRVRAYNVQYTTCTQKVVHFRECTGHVRDWTRFVCRSETPGFYRKPKISGKGPVPANDFHMQAGPAGCQSDSLVIKGGKAGVAHPPWSELINGNKYKDINKNIQKNAAVFIIFGNGR
ncbi:hypothetical protein Bbelb_261970 [Branchiostoma belcheri]|nr:hypothetical protein Bbelb_261970 [Branchiostoma belcheri]